MKAQQFQELSLSDLPDARIPRHYGLDWLRIGAFALLIVFHIGLYFAPGHWIVKSPQLYDWIALPLAAIVPWRLSVLFAVSGYATAAMLQRFPSMGAFLAERSKRLLIPLLFGMLVIVPPQGWVRMAVSGGHASFADFLRDDAFSFSSHAGAFMPGWEHLWFLPYLWSYTALLLGLIALRPDWKHHAVLAATWLAVGHRLLWAPGAVMLAGMAALSLTRVPGVVDSADYLPAFVIGFGYAHLPQLRIGFRRQFRGAALVSLAMLALIWTTLAMGPAVPGRIAEFIGLIAGGVMSWTMIPVAFHCAERWLNRDHKWRQPLAAAVFPAYIVHQTVIVYTGWHLSRLGVVGWRALAIELAMVAAAALAAYLLARGVPVLGALLGMPRRQHRLRSSGGRELAPA